MTLRNVSFEHLAVADWAVDRHSTQSLASHRGIRFSLENCYEDTMADVSRRGRTVADV